MSKTFCISCDLEACNHQLHFNILSSPYDHRLPDEWIMMVKGDPQNHEARNFCSYHCLSGWISMEREIERKAELENMHMLEAEDKKHIDKKRMLFMLLIQDFLRENDRTNGFIHARSRTLQEIFALRFPDTPKLTETIEALAETSSNIWRYTFLFADDEHIAWAEKAKACGLIDHYTVSEVPA